MFKQLFKKLHDMVVFEYPFADEVIPEPRKIFNTSLVLENLMRDTVNREYRIQQAMESLKNV